MYTSARFFRRLLWAALVVLVVTLAHGQNARWDIGQPGSAGAVTVSGSGGLQPLLAQPGVSLNWCNYPANAVPCTDFANTYTSISSSTLCPTNTPIVLQGSSTCVGTSDNLGDLGVYTLPGTYAYTLTVNGVSSGPYVVTLSLNPASNMTFSGNDAFTGNATFASIDTIRFVDGVTYTTVQAAINSLPGSGGSVRIPCGTFVGPTAIPSNTSLVSICERPASLAYATLWGTNPGGVFSALSGTVLTYSANLSLTQAQNIVLSDLVLDFSNGGFGVNLTSVSLVRMTNVLIDRCGSATQPCLNMTTTGSLATNNNLLNTFDHLKINAAPPSGTVTGVVLNGNAANSNFVTQNFFYDLKVGGALAVGLDFQTNCDTNWFFGVTVNSSSANAMGIQFNNASPGSDHDANSIQIYGYSCAAGCASPFLRFGQSSGNYVVGLGNGVAPTVVGGNPAFLVFWSGATGGSVPSTYSNSLNTLDATLISQINLSARLLYQEGTLGAAAPNFDVCEGSSASHSLQCSYNNGAFFNIAQTIGVGNVTTAGSAVNTGTCQAQTGITITGAATTDNVTANIGSVLPATWQTGIQLSAHVTTSNTITVYLCNPTAGNITPVATQVNVRVVR